MPKKINVPEKGLVEIEKSAVHLEIDSEASLLQASAYRSELKAYLKSLTADKEKLTKPALATLKEIRARYKPREEAVEALIVSLDAKMTRYQTALMQASQKAQEKLASKVDSGYMKAETAIDRMDALNVDKKAGTTTFIATKCFEVMSMLELPVEYHIANDTDIRKAMLAGIELPGVKYWTEQRPRNTA